MDRFGPNCAERRAVRDFHFDNLHRLLMPTHLKFFLWLVFQSKEVLEAPVAEAGAGEAGAPQGATLWTLLVQELGLTPEQGERFRAHLRRILSDPNSQLETWRLEFAVAYIGRLRSIISFVASRTQAQLEGVRAILTPAQLVRFSAWSARNAKSISAVLAAEGGGGGGGGGAAGAQ